MMRFLGFKASLSFGSTRNRREIEDYSIATVNATAGSYKPKREEFFGNGSLSRPPKKITPSMVILGHSSNQQEKNDQKYANLSKSTGNLAQPPQNQPPLNTQPTNNVSLNIPVNVRQSAPNVNQDPRGGTSNNSVPTVKKTEPAKKEQKILNQKQKTIAANESKARKMLEQEKKKQRKLAEQQEKLRKEKERAEKRQMEKAKKSKKNKPPPAPLTTQQPPPPPPPPPEQINRTNLPQTSRQGHSTNTIDSSISRSSGPPPYSDKPVNPAVRPNQSDATGNTSFGQKIEETSSWDLVNQHRQQMAPPSGVVERRPKQKVMDLKYDVGKVHSEVKNSEA